MKGSFDERSIYTLSLGSVWQNKFDIETGPDLFAWVHIISIYNALHEKDLAKWD